MKNKSHEAYKERDLHNIVELKNKHERLKEFFNNTKIIKNFSDKDPINGYIVYPPIESLDTLNDLLSKFSFSLPKKNIPYINIPITSALEKKINLKNYRKDINFVKNSKLKELLKKYHILIHDVNSLNKFSILKFGYKIKIIDKNFYSDVEAETLRNLFYSTLTSLEKNTYIKLSKRNFINMSKLHKNKKYSYIFTSGPTFEKYKDIKYKNNSLKIICNSIIKNTDFLDHINGPDIITFADPVFHFGPSEYAKQFRKDLIKVVKKYNSFIVIPQSNVPLFIEHFPEIKNNIIGLSINDKLNFPTSKNLFVKSTANILTLFMVPIASTLTKIISIIGADGREPGENYFWKHNDKAQYTDKMESVFLEHPSFFRDRNYEDYYKTHCDLLEDLIIFGEFKNNVYYSSTNSYIPALKERFIKSLNKKKMQKLNKISNKSKKDFIMREINFDFAKKMNTLYAYINEFKTQKLRIAIYGNGIIGNIFRKELQDKVIIVIDQKVHFKDKKVCLPSEIKNYNFDIVINTVLGREKEVLASLEIDKNKFYTIDLTKKPNKLVFIDINDKTYKDPSNILGPFSLKSNLSIDETKLISLYFKNKKKGVMIDVGAHYGSSSKDFLDKGWIVYGYEPDPNNRKILENNLHSYSNFYLSSKAISNKAGDLINFYASKESSGISGLSSFTDKHKKICHVSTTTLKNEINELNINKIDFLKIDTEGFDLMVLEGFPWENMHPSVIECEFEDFKTKPLGFLSNKIADFLVKKGYLVFISEWYPIEKYGITHKWKRLYKYKNQVIDSNVWGNILAFKKDGLKKELLIEFLEKQNIQL